MQLDVAVRSRRSEVARHWVPWVVWSGFLAFSAALFTNTVLYGRLPLAAVVQVWIHSLVLTATFAMASGWWLVYGGLLVLRGSRLGVRPAVVPAVPLLGTTLPLLAIYSSDLANHYFYYSMVQNNQPKTLSLLLLLLLATLLLQLVHLEMAAGIKWRDAWDRVVARVREPFTLALLAVVGLLQVSTYLDRIFDDFLLRYLAIADAMYTGSPYPAAITDGIWRPFFVEGGVSKYLVDLPAYPAMVAACFVAIGHNVLAVYIPTVVCNVLIPPALYLLYREVLSSRAVALSLTGLTVLLPPLRLYALNWTGPEVLFFAVLPICCWLCVKAIKGDDRRRTWAALGAAAAVLALSRPEGIAYALACVAAAMLRPAPRTSKYALGSLFVLPLGAFSAYMMAMFNTPWPRSGVASLNPGNIPANILALANGEIQSASQRMRLSTAELVAIVVLLLLVALAGMAYLLRRNWRLGLIFLPTWANLLTLLAMDPRNSGIREFFDFFRHASYPVPLLILAAGVAVEAAIQLSRTQRVRTIATAGAVVMLLWVVAWNVDMMAKPAFSYGADASNVLGSGRMNLMDLLSHHPFDIRVFQFEKVDGYWVLTAWRGALWGYPDYLREFFSRFDTVAAATGVAYQMGSLFIYLAALLLAVVPGAGSRAHSRTPAGAKTD